jgi:hypothetical protein
LRFHELDIWVVEEAGEVVIHVRCDHVEYRAFSALGLWPLDCHLFEPKDIVVRQHLQQLDLSQRRDWEAILLIVHQNLLEREDPARDAMPRFVHFAEGSLAELLHHLVLANLGASLESALQALRRRNCWIRHGGGWGGRMSAIKSVLVAVDVAPAPGARAPGVDWSDGDESRQAWKGVVVGEGTSRRQELP